MAHQYSASIKGQQQGQFHGPPKSGGHHSIPLIGFDFSMTAPVDAATAGHGSGRRHKPIRIAVESGAMGQQLFHAFCNHEVLDEVIIRRQPEKLAYTVSLTNAAMPGYAAYGAQGPGRPSNPGRGPAGDGAKQPETVAYTIHLTGATIVGYETYAGSRPDAGNRGKQPVSFQLDYSDIQVLPFRR